jgi:succinyl-CoA synthetase beta subunit
MKIHEYQAKQLFRRYHIPVPAGDIACTPDEATAVARKFEKFPLAVKAQIHAGGRGKSGGVRLAWSFDELATHAEAILGMNLVTPQTGPEGRLVRQVLIEEGVDILNELYLSLMVDRETACVLVIASGAGGMDIETVAAETPEKIARVPVNPLVGIKRHHCRQVAGALDLDESMFGPFCKLLFGLYALFVENDCSLLEINPLILTAEGNFTAIDAKIEIDDSALYRHKDLLAFRDLNEEDPLEIEASKYKLNYINMDGTVGNMVNGAGLAMAVMDTIKLAGAEPANFLDVGGGATAEMIENGFRIILSDPKVRAILINIFGGILRCDVLADGVVAAARKIDVKVPVIVRMEGTNVEEGRDILARSGLSIYTAADMKDAGDLVARLAASNGNPYREASN